MSGSICRQCGCGVLERDSARGDTVCTNCGTVLEENAIVNEVQFQETSGGGHAAVGQFVNPDASTKMNIGGVTIGDKQSREVTLQNARRRIQDVASQLRLNSHCVEMALNFYKMALSRDLTRGRAWTHTVAACLYITCRLEGTSHFLLDFSDVLQVNVYELGRTYNALARSLYITLPPTDPCVYVMRFANALEFGDKEHDVAMIALRLVQRMKRDWMAIGRRPTGLCGAALLLAARYHNFNRTVNDIVRVANIGETVIRRRLEEFASTPSSSLTLDDFVTVDLEDECDPPAYNVSRHKTATQVPSDAKLEKMRVDLLKTEREIEKMIDSKKSGKSVPKAENGPAKSTSSSKSKKIKLFPNLAYPESASEPLDEELEISQEFLSQETLRHIMPSEFADGQDANEETDEFKETPLAKYENYRPTLKSIGVKLEPSTANGQCAVNVIVGKTEEISKKEDVDDGTLDLSGIDDEEIENYLLREDEVSIKRRLWQIHYEPYVLDLEQRRQKREEELKMLEAQGLFKKRRPRVAKPKQGQQPFSSFGEAVEKIVQEKKLSSKINYDVLKSLTEPLSTTRGKLPEQSAQPTSPAEEDKSASSCQTKSQSDSTPVEDSRTQEKSQNIAKTSVINVDTKLDGSEGADNEKSLKANATPPPSKLVNFRKKPKLNATLLSKKSTS